MTFKRPATPTRGSRPLAKFCGAAKWIEQNTIHVPLLNAWGILTSKLS
jgi:hypothetical protein